MSHAYPNTTKLNGHLESSKVINGIEEFTKKLAHQKIIILLKCILVYNQIPPGLTAEMNGRSWSKSPIRNLINQIYNETLKKIISANGLHLSKTWEQRITILENYYAYDLDRMLNSLQREDLNEILKSGLSSEKDPDDVLFYLPEPEKYSTAQLHGLLKIYCIDGLFDNPLLDDEDPEEEEEEEEEETVHSDFLSNITETWSRPRQISRLMGQMGFGVPKRLSSTKFEDFLSTISSLGIEVIEENGTEPFLVCYIYVNSKNNPSYPTASSRVRLRKIKNFNDKNKIQILNGKIYIDKSIGFFGIYKGEFVHTGEIYVYWQKWVEFCKNKTIHKIEDFIDNEPKMEWILHELKIQYDVEIPEEFRVVGVPASTANSIGRAPSIPKEPSLTGESCVALQVPQPYAELIVRGQMNVHNLSEASQHRGLLLIYAAPVVLHAEMRRYQFSQLPTAAFVGVVEVDACEFEAKSHWHEEGCHGLYLHKARYFASPVPFAPSSTEFFAVSKVVVQDALSSAHWARRTSR